jgi:hypothetical protein
LASVAADSGQHQFGYHNQSLVWFGQFRLRKRLFQLRLLARCNQQL